jgi:Ketopantoate reductase PanE/ApbA C terminal
VNGEGISAVMRDLVDECVAVAKADGVLIPGDVDMAVRRIAETVPGRYSSTAQDLSRGKRTEIDHLNGRIVRRGEALGVSPSLGCRMRIRARQTSTRRQTDRQNKMTAPTFARRGLCLQAGSAVRGNILRQPQDDVAVASPSLSWLHAPSH